MHANQPYQIPTGIDYLNQIATPPPKPSFDKKTKILLAIIGVFCVATIGIILTQAHKASGVPTPSAIGARLYKLEKLSSSYKKKLHNTALQDINSSLLAVLTTAKVSLDSAFSSINLSLKDVSKQFNSLDPSDQLEAKFDEAYLNTNLDQTYQREMAYQLQETVSQMRLLAAKRQPDNAFTLFLNKTATDLESIQKRLAAQAREPLTN